MTFRDRRDAGRLLARLLAQRAFEASLVLGLPRGGVVVAAEVAEFLALPLDVVVVRKVGVPGHGELALGAVGEDGVLVINADVAGASGITAERVQLLAAREHQEAQRRAVLFRGTRTALPLAGQSLLIVDDGLATGATARAACRVVRARGAARVLLAVPVGAEDAVAALAAEADEVVCLAVPPRFSAVGQWYDDFGQTSDAEVIRLLVAAAARVE